MLTVNAVWRRDRELPAIERIFETAKQFAQDVTGPSDKRALSANNDLCLFTHVLATYRRH